MESVFLEPKSLTPQVDEDEVCEMHSKRLGSNVTWHFYSGTHASLGVLLSLCTLGLYYLLTIAYPDTLPGPTWLISLVCYSPFFAAIILNRKCLTQIYIINLIVFVAIWLMIPSGVGVRIWLGIPFGFGFWFLMAVSLHIWAHRFMETDIGLSWMIRFVAMFSATLYIQGSIYGILVSPAIQFYKAPFVLQPISVFGFGSFEILVIYTNLAIAWFACKVAGTKDIRKSLTPWRSNPLIILVTLWVVWLIIAGVIRGTQSPIAYVKVATISGNVETHRAGYSHLDRAAELGVIIAEKIRKTGAEFVVAPEGNVETHRAGYSHLDRAAELGVIIAEKIRKTGAEFVVAPEFVLRSDDGQTGCVESIQNAIVPQVIGLGAYVVVGCSAFDRFDTSRSDCRVDNLAYTISPDGKIIDVYGKMNPTPGEKSCYQPGYFVNEGHGIKFGTVICYDVDYISPIARVADLGASLILNPSHDWHKVRHHFTVAVIRAIENRVVIAKSEYGFDPVIVDPFGNILAQGFRRDAADLFAEVPLSEPLKGNWWRQQILYWVLMTIFAALMVLDLIRVCYTSRK
jgi:predicted amidohydrolase